MTSAMFLKVTQPVEEHFLILAQIRADSHHSDTRVLVSGEDSGSSGTAMTYRIFSKHWLGIKGAWEPMGCLLGLMTQVCIDFSWMLWLRPIYCLLCGVHVVQFLCMNPRYRPEANKVLLWSIYSFIHLFTNVEIWFDLPLESSQHP